MVIELVDDDMGERREADPVLRYVPRDELKKMVDKARLAMEKAARELEFMEAARLRDEYLALKKQLDEK